MHTSYSNFWGFIGAPNILEWHCANHLETSVAVDLTLEDHAATESGLLGGSCWWCCDCVGPSEMMGFLGSEKPLEIGWGQH